MRALVRPPGDSYPDALTRQVPPPPVDLALAREQHRQYREALGACGIDVIALPQDDEHPDAVFCQDPVLVVQGRAIWAQPAAPSRQGEAAALLDALRSHLPVVELQPPATLDGGDVLGTEDRLYVGLSARSNDEACRQLSQVTGLPVKGIPIPGSLLHLLTGCTYLGENRLLAVRELASLFPEMSIVPAPDEEAYCANALIAGRHAVIPSGYPRTAQILQGHGFTLHPVPMSEFAKRDGGVTCLSLLY